LRNLHLFAVILCGHFTEGSTFFSKEGVEGESKGGWYLRQILASGNFTAGRWASILAGHLNYQIEHHLFPTMPAWRYPKIAKSVQQ
ncbi:MAG: acyl-CoA desaturase, partial [Desulfuromonadales bacterium]|nr:acyl-CoA desaturase [Desulfuromonadales bacterium]